MHWHNEIMFTFLAWALRFISGQHNGHII